jgi:hypothetical protein
MYLNARFSTYLNLFSSYLLINFLNDNLENDFNHYKEFAN